MSQFVLTWALILAQALLGAAMICASYRVLFGPRAQDRVIALDTLYVIAMLALMVFGIQTGRAVYFEAALIIAILGFTSMVALAKFLMRGEVIE
jgi:multicomponent K+:H+ antiporter subunit F